MTEEHRKILLPLREDIRKKVILLGKAREMDAIPNILVAIRRKIYDAQDLLATTSVKLRVEIPSNWYAGK